MKRILSALMLMAAAGIAGIGSAQTVPVATTYLQDGNALACPTGSSGTCKIVWTPVLGNVPTVYHKPGGGMATATPMSSPVVNGVSLIPAMPDSALTIPENLCWRVTLNTPSGPSLLASCVQPSASNSWYANGVDNFDNWLPTIAALPVYGSGVTINGYAGAFNFVGSGVSCNFATFTCTFSSGGGGGSMTWPTFTGLAAYGGSSNWVTPTYSMVAALWASGACIGLLKSDGTCVLTSSFDASGAASAAQAASLQRASNLSDLASASTARTNLGLGTAATQPSSAFDAAGAAAAAQTAAETASDAAGAAAAAQAASLQKASNLSDLASASTARTNLGLGTAATQASSAFDAAGAAAAAQSAAEAASDAAGSAATAQSNAEAYARSVNTSGTAAGLSANIAESQVTNLPADLAGKQAAGTYITGVTGTAPVSSSGGTAPAISMAQATTSVDGYLAHGDWNTFNGKQAALGYTPANCTAGTTGSDCLTLSSGLVPAANLPQINLASTSNGGVTGALPAASVASGALASGMTATTQTAADNTTKVATDAFVTTAVANGAYTLPSQYGTWTCQPGIGDGTNAITGATYYQTTCRNESGVTQTISGIRCFTDNSGSSTLNATDGSSNALLTGAITCSSSWASGTLGSTTTIASGGFVKFTFVADGTSKQATFDIYGRF